MVTSILAIVAGLANVATWYFTRRSQDKNQKLIVKALGHKYDILFSKYSELVKERNTLRNALSEAEKKLYEEASLADIIDTVNRLLRS